MFEQAFRNIDDVLRKEAGCTTELDYTEQSSWLLFLKYLASLEEDKATEAQLDGKKYSYILEKQFRWENWAAPKNAAGEIDHNQALIGDDLVEFANQKLFPYLHGFKQRATGPDTIEYKIGEIFGEIKNKIQSGYNLREIIDHIDELKFHSQKEKHELSHLYEAKIKNMGNAGRNGGEYYTPRPLIRAMIQVVKPEIGEKIYDGACGSAGFLCEAFEYLKKGNLTVKQFQTLQEKTFYGKEKKSLAYVTRAKLLQGLSEKDFGRDALGEMQKIIGAENSDLFDVLAYVAYALPPVTRKERADHARVYINSEFNTKQQAFLDFVLSHYVSVGVEELNSDKLTPLLRLKYNNSISDAVVDLGSAEDIGKTFTGFQKYLYA